MKKISSLSLLLALVILGGSMKSLADKTEKPSRQQLIDMLGLQGHVEGGFYRRTFQADHRDKVTTANGQRFTMTSIYYLLTAESPVGHFHKNQSDIMHFFHLGDPIRYYLIHPDGRLEVKVLGPDVASGQEFQFVVKGGVWKASEVAVDGNYGYGLISEAVSPGFDFADMSLATQSQLMKSFPQHESIIKRLAKTGDEEKSGDIH